MSGAPDDQQKALVQYQPGTSGANAYGQGPGYAAQPSYGMEPQPQMMASPTQAPQAQYPGYPRPQYAAQGYSPAQYGQPMMQQGQAFTGTPYQQPQQMAYNPTAQALGAPTGYGQQASTGYQQQAQTGYQQQAPAGYQAYIPASQPTPTQAVPPTTNSMMKMANKTECPPYTVHRDVLLPRLLTLMELADADEVDVPCPKRSSLTMQYGLQGRSFKIRTGIQYAGELLQQLAKEDQDAYPKPKLGMYRREKGTLVKGRLNSPITKFSGLSSLWYGVDKPDECVLVIFDAPKSAKVMGF